MNRDLRPATGIANALIISLALLAIAALLWCVL